MEMKSRFESEKKYSAQDFLLNRGAKKSKVCYRSLTTVKAGKKLTNYESTGTRIFYTNKLGEAKTYQGEFFSNVKSIKSEKPQIDTDCHRQTGIVKEPVEIRVTLWGKKRRSKNGQTRAVCTA